MCYVWCWLVFVCARRATTTASAARPRALADRICEIKKKKCCVSLAVVCACPFACSHSVVGVAVAVEIDLRDVGVGNGYIMYKYMMQRQV